MAQRDSRRMTSKRPPEGTVLFLLGMSPPRLWHPRAWLAVFSAMPKLLIYLGRHPEAGLLSSKLYLGRSIMVVTYWRSVDDLRGFAADSDAPHLPMWRWFRKRYDDTAAVGIWHETYVIGEHESVSAGMPPYGLSEAVGWEPVGRGTATSAQRMGTRAAATA